MNSSISIHEIDSLFQNRKCLTIIIAKAEMQTETPAESETAFFVGAAVGKAVVGASVGEAVIGAEVVGDRVGANVGDLVGGWRSWTASCTGWVDEHTRAIRYELGGNGLRHLCSNCIISSE
jgi:hypothetical protein